LTVAGHFKPELFKHELFKHELLNMNFSKYPKGIRPGLKLGFENSRVELPYK
jgi:hypothetical protein